MVVASRTTLCRTVPVERVWDVGGQCFLSHDGRDDLIMHAGASPECRFGIGAVDDFCVQGPGFGASHPGQLAKRFRGFKRNKHITESPLALHTRLHTTFRISDHKIEDRMVLFSCYTIHVLIVILYYCITVLRYYRITVTVTVTVTVTDATAATGTAAAAATVTVSVTILYYTVLYYTIPYDSKIL